MRLFTAITLPKEIKDKTSEIMRGRLPVPYINTTNLHITLNFIGEVESEKVKNLINNFPIFLAQQKPFKIEFDKLQKFRQQIHITLKPNFQLEKLQSLLEEKLRLNGLKLEERSYYPHVTLANLHFDHVLNPQRKLELFPNKELEKLNFLANVITLYESKLLLHHAHHESLIECILE